MGVVGALQYLGAGSKAPIRPLVMEAHNGTPGLQSGVFSVTDAVTARQRRGSGKECRVTCMRPWDAAKSKPQLRASAVQRDSDSGLSLSFFPYSPTAYRAK